MKNLQHLEGLETSELGSNSFSDWKTIKKEIKGNSGFAQITLNRGTFKKYTNQNSETGEEFISLVAKVTEENTIRVSEEMFSKMFLTSDKNKVIVTTNEKGYLAIAAVHNQEDSEKCYFNSKYIDLD